MIPRFLRHVAILSLFAVLWRGAPPLRAAAAASGAPAQPNIVVILVDDMGWSDLGCYGGEIPTPHLDALAKNGVALRSSTTPAGAVPRGPRY